LPWTHHVGSLHPISITYIKFCVMKNLTLQIRLPVVKCVWNMTTHGEGKWRGKWRMEWVASTRTLLRNVVYPALLTLTRTPRLRAVHWTDAHADLNGLVCFSERRNLVSVSVPSRFERSLSTYVVNIFSQTVRHGLCLHEETIVFVGRFWQTHLVRFFWNCLTIRHNRVRFLKRNASMILF